MTIDVGVIQSSTIALELKAIGQFVLWGKYLGIQVVNTIVEKIGMSWLLEAIRTTRSVCLGQIETMSMTIYNNNP